MNQRATRARPRRNRSETQVRARSDTLGTLEVRRDRSGLKLMAHGILYSIRPDTAMETPAPWLALAAAPWVGERAEGRAPLRILILGYGGGTVARLIRGLDRNAEIIGVEPDPGIRRIAATEMGVRALGATVVGTDACSYLSRRGPVFDAVIDDVFAPRRGRLARPGDAVRLPELVRRRLKPGGVYAVNLISPGGAEERATVERVRAVFRHVMVAYLGA